LKSSIKRSERHRVCNVSVGGGRGSTEIVYILRPDQCANEEQASRQQRTQNLAHEFPLQPQTEDISRHANSEYEISLFLQTILWSNQLKKSDVELFYGEKMSDARPVRCQKCGKPLGYVTVLAKGLTPFQQPIQEVKIVAICIECFQKKK